MSDKNLWKISAVDAVNALKNNEVTSVELVEAAISRIEEVDDRVNALPIRCFERALRIARAFDADRLNTNKLELAGLPIAVKDYNDVGGVKTTFGSPIYSDHIPRESDATVALLEERGALPIAKSNVPEWAGGHTFNPVHGITRNPWNTGRSAGGSSGGSAVALATGQVWLATGNDLGGSLRTPAGFNGVVGLRPGPGIVPRGERLQSFDSLWVEGPMGRTVADVALMLDAGSGRSLADPFSFDRPQSSYLSEIDKSSLPKRVAFSRDLGVVPVSEEVNNVSIKAIEVLIRQGVDVTHEIPNFGGALEAFQTLRAVLLGTMMGELLEKHRSQIAVEIVDNIEKGFNITPTELFEAERVRWNLYRSMTVFFETHDFLICPSASIPPFPVEKRFIDEIDGKACKTYIDWFSITFALTMTSCPVISIPCGFTSDGLPVGIQILGKPRSEATLLQFAHLFEKMIGISAQIPISPKN